MTLFVVDIHPVYQADLRIADLKAAGIVGLTCKITEGTRLYRPGYHAFSAAARSAGLLFAAYHWLRSEEDGDAQAAWMQRCMGEDWGRVLVMIDWERADIANTIPNKRTADTFADAVVARGGRIALDYLPRWIWRLLGEPDLTTGRTSTLALIASDYGHNPVGSPADLYPGDASTRWAPYGGHPVALLQFGSRCRIPGYAGDLDINAYRGTLTQLRALFTGAPPTEEDQVSLKDPVAIPATPLGVDDVRPADTEPADVVLGYTLARATTIQATQRQQGRAIAAIGAQTLANAAALTDLKTAVDALTTGGVDLDALADKVAARLLPHLPTQEQTAADIAARISNG